MNALTETFTKAGKLSSSAPWLGGEISKLDGFVHPESHYSPRRAFKAIPMSTRSIIDYPADDLWERDTRTLPRALAEYRGYVRVFAEKNLRPLAMKIDLAGHEGAASYQQDIQKLLSLAAKAGFFSDMLPRPFGSTPLTRFRFPIGLQQAIKVEELARVCGGLMLLLSAHNLGVAPLVMSGDLSALRKFLLPALKENQAGNPHLFAYGITEPAAGSDVEEGHGASLYKPATVARKVPGGWELSGRKCFISGGDKAKSITVFAALEGEPMNSWTCFLVRSHSPGFRVARTELKMGMRASAAAELEFDQVFVPDDHVIGGLRRGWAINRAILNLSRLPVAAMAVGFAQAATEHATRFACEYHLAGKPLIDYQETQLQIAQLIADTSAMRALVWHSGLSWRSQQSKASINKFFCSDMAVSVCDRAMQLMSNHGGHHANAVEKCFRDARLTQIFEGTNQINRLAVIEDMQEELLGLTRRNDT